MSSSPLIKDQLIWATDELQEISDTARLDSEILLAHCLNKNRSYLMTWPELALTPDVVECFRGLIQKRMQPQPVAYLVGEREFYSMTLKTTAATLVPRPETEMLVDRVLELIDGLRSPRVLELGTGTGAIALAIKKHARDAEVIATDFSQPALEIAQQNQKSLHLDVSLMLSDWYQQLGDVGQFDVIVSNPPYIAEGDDYLSQGDLPAEPQHALVSGKQGQDALSTIIKGARQFLKPNGWLVLEHGHDQQPALHHLMTEAGLTGVNTRLDFNQLPRLTEGQVVE